MMRFREVKGAKREGLYVKDCKEKNLYQKAQIEAFDEWYGHILAVAQAKRVSDDLAREVSDKFREEQARRMREADKPLF